jgi:DNA-binding CsgD family transcriptional regulator
MLPGELMRLEVQLVSKSAVNAEPFTGTLDIWKHFAEGISSTAAALLDETSTPEERIRSAEFTLRKLLSRQLAALPCQDTLLSPRESGILRLIGQGQSNKSIARLLGIAPETVKSYAKQIFRKLNARNRAEAFALAAQSNLI